MAERKTAANAAAETEKSSLSQREPMERTENGGPSAQILSGAPMPPLGAKGGGAAGAAPGGSARRCSGKLLLDTKGVVFVQEMVY